MDMGHSQGTREGHRGSLVPIQGGFGVGKGRCSMTALPGRSPRTGRSQDREAPGQATPGLVLSLCVLRGFWKAEGPALPTLQAGAA